LANPHFFINLMVDKQTETMSDFPIKTRHYNDVKGFVSHTRHDVSDNALKKKALSVMFLKKYMDEMPKQPRLISSAEGKIKSILFTLPKYLWEGEDNPFAKVFKDLFLKLPQHTQIVVLSHDTEIKHLKDWFKEKQVKNELIIVNIPDYINFTIWAEDAYAVLTDDANGEHYFVEPHSFPRWEDGFIADFVSKATNFKRTQIPLYFEGGNFLVGDDFFLLGADYPVVSLKYIGTLVASEIEESEPELVTRLYKQYLDHSRKLIYVGSTLPVPRKQSKEYKMKGETWKEHFFQKNEGGTVQPIFHIDMFLTLLGRSESGNYRIMVGDPRMASVFLNENMMPYAMAEIFDNIAENLAKEGFEIIRNPLPLIYMDDEKEKERNWHFATYNNCMVENDNDSKKVWMPTYGHGNWKELERLDQINKKILEDQGFEVILLGDFHPFVENSGSLHCIKKYLSRE
jgi:hypothetical protein